MDKVVIFDWGGIVESHENDNADLNNAKIKTIRHLNPHLSEKEILEGWEKSTSDLPPISTINDEDDLRKWVKNIESIFKVNITYEDFKKLYEKSFSDIKFYKDVVSYAHSLKNKCKIAILSNLMAFDKKRINDQYDLSKFDNVYLSFELGLKKPSYEIYKYVIKDLNTLPENILLIDDTTDNIEMAKKWGINTCQAYGYELDKIKKAVAAFLES